MSKSAAAVLAFFGFMLFSIPMSAQFNGLLPNGNVYGGVSYAPTHRRHQQTELSRVGTAPSRHFLSRAIRISAWWPMPAVSIARAVTQYNLRRRPALLVQLRKMASFHSRHGRHPPRQLRRLHLQSARDRRRRRRRLQTPLQEFFLALAGRLHAQPLPSATQNDYRASTGIVWRF